MTGAPDDAWPLRTVDDVARVCAAHGLAQFSDRSIVWRYGDLVVVISTDPRGRLVVVDVRAAGRNICRVWHDAPSAVLTAAIEAARTAESATDEEART